MGLCVLLGLYIGTKLDEWLDTAPYLMLVFLLIGIAAGFREVIRVARQMLRESQAADQQSDSSSVDEEKRQDQ